ncbi:MAG: LacI family transcriptional regulator [Bacteroidetes bacterium]|nr:LacI family transcriptional regulator [Bacteroidota bacterium]
MKNGIKEVAKKANVSTATVSRVLNSSEVVTEETKRRVLAVIDELNYMPHAIGRALVTRQTNLIGVILPDVHSEFFSELIRGIDKAARQHNYHIIVSSTHSDKREIESMLTVMQGGRVDGLIIMSPHIDTEEVIKHLSPLSRVVFVNSYLNGASFDSVTIDNYGGAYQMVEHLIEHGHKRIAILKGEERNYDAQERFRGYLDAVKDNGLDRIKNFELLGDFTEESGYDAMIGVLRMKSKPTAIFCSNDSMALGALRAMHEKDIIVPGEIALAGFDDVPSARYVLPSLTSVHVPIFEMGKEAVEHLFVSLEGKNGGEGKKMMLPTLVIKRESCGCTPVAT